MTKAVHSFRANTPVSTSTARGFGHDEDGNGVIVEMPVATFTLSQVATGRNLRESRKALDLTIGDVSRITGLTVSEVSSLELGEASIDAFLYLDELRTGKGKP